MVLLGAVAPIAIVPEEAPRMPPGAEAFLHQITNPHEVDGAMIAVPIPYIHDGIERAILLRLQIGCVQFRRLLRERSHVFSHGNAIHH